MTRFPSAGHLASWAGMLSTGTLYCDPGDDFYTRLNPDKAKNRALDQLRKSAQRLSSAARRSSSG